MRRHIRRHRHHWFSLRAWRTRLIFWLGAVLVGVAAAVFALLGEQADHFYRDHVASSVWLPFVVTPFGLMAAAWITRRFFPGAEGSGIPQTLVALSSTGGALCGRLLAVRIVFGKILLTVMGLFSGASVGREGPTVHVGAAIMYSIGQYAHVPARYLKRGLILTGGGAGVAAAFNTPLAGVMFAIEEMAGSFDRRNIGMMVIGIVFAGMTAIFIHQDNYNYYGAMPADLDFNWIWLAVAVCGVAGGLLGGSFSAALIWSTSKLRPYMSQHSLKVAFVCGLTLAAIGTLSGGIVYGTGYIEAKQIVSCSGVEHCEVEVGLAYPFLKILATIASYLSAIPAGIFAPSLATGAGLGHDIAQLFPEHLMSAVVVLGMVGYFSGVVQTPITAFVIVMEMTDNQDMVLAMMATSLLATGASKLVCRKPVYGVLAKNFLRGLAEEKKEKIAGKPESR